MVNKEIEYRLFLFIMNLRGFYCVCFILEIYKKCVGLDLWYIRDCL